MSTQGSTCKFRLEHISKPGVVPGDEEAGCSGDTQGLTPFAAGIDGMGGGGRRGGGQGGVARVLRRQHVREPLTSLTVQQLDLSAVQRFCATRQHG